MGRIDRQGREDREKLVEEHGFQPFALGLAGFARLQHAQSRGRQFRLDLLPQPLLHSHQVRRRGVDPQQLLGRGQTVLAQHPDPLADLTFQAGDADHVEFIEIIGRDRQEPQPLQERMAGVVALLEHPFVERQPGQFPVEEPRRRCGQIRFQLELRRRRRTASGGRSGHGVGVAHWNPGV